MRSPTKLHFLFYDFFCNLLWFFKDLVKINIKLDFVTGFGSSRKPVNRFQSSGRKSGLGPNKCSILQKKGKSLFYLLQLSLKFGFPPTTIKPGISPPLTFQTVHFTSLERFWRLFATVTVVLSFSFFKKILVESLKNHSKSQKNHKIENTILLDSTWVDIRSEYIIWYTLV